MVLIYPVMQVLLLAIIDSMRREEDKVIRIGNQWIRIKHKKWKIGEKGWVRMARVGMPIAFLMSGLAIVAPGIVNTLTA